MKNRKALWRLIGALILLSAFVVAGIYFFATNDTDSKVSESDEEPEKQIVYDSTIGVYSSQGIDIVADDTSELEEKSEEELVDTAKTKKIYFTFDDGPSIYTDRILDIFDSYGLKATFFVQAKDDQTSIKAYKRIVDEGHTLALHSYSHKYSEIYASIDNFKKDVNDLQEYLYDITGVWCRIYRFPGGSSNTVSKIPMSECIQYLDSAGITYFDWNISSEDAVAGKMLSVDTIIDNCTRSLNKYDECVILMHDSALRRSTVDALIPLIDYLNSRGDCEILPITEDTKPVQHNF